MNTTLDYFENMTVTGYVNLVWGRDSDGYYYICEITDSYQYSRYGAHETTGIVNFAACTFSRVGFENLVPETVIEELNQSGLIRYVHDVMQLKRLRSSRKCYKNKELPSNNILPL